MREYLEKELLKFESLEQRLLDPIVLSDSQQLAKISSEYGALTSLIRIYRKYKQVSEEVDQWMALSESGDADERKYAATELEQLVRQKSKLWDELAKKMATDQETERTRCVMEIRAGVGGDEAALFVSELVTMYQRFAEKKNWRWEMLDMKPTVLGGFKEVTLAYNGAGVFRQLQFESGAHRVQRVPSTESRGRIQTSVATIAVLPEPEEVEIELRPEDYRRDNFKASGPGGQKVNKTDSAVRLTHFETGIVVSIQDGASSHRNLAKALRILKTRLFQRKWESQQAKRAKKRKSLVGKGARSERIRTYNFPDNRVTDHRINLTLRKLHQVLQGNVDLISDKLLQQERELLNGE